MFVRQSTRRRRRKPAKPYPSFPLTPHNNGQWCKKIRGKVYFFGVWDDADSALQNYLRVAEDLHAGRQPCAASVVGQGVTVKDLCNQFLASPRANNLVNFLSVFGGPLRPRSSFDLTTQRRCCERVFRTVAPGARRNDESPVTREGLDLKGEWRERCAKRSGSSADLVPVIQGSFSGGRGSSRRCGRWPRCNGRRCGIRSSGG